MQISKPKLLNFLSHLIGSIHYVELVCKGYLETRYVNVRGSGHSSVLHHMYMVPLLADPFCGPVIQRLFGKHQKKYTSQSI